MNCLDVDDLNEPVSQVGHGPGKAEESFTFIWTLLVDVAYNNINKTKRTIRASTMDIVHVPFFFRFSAPLVISLDISDHQIIGQCAPRLLHEYWRYMFQSRHLHKIQTKTFSYV